MAENQTCWNALWPHLFTVHNSAQSTCPKWDTWCGHAALWLSLVCIYPQDHRLSHFHIMVQMVLNSAIYVATMCSWSAFRKNYIYKVIYCTLRCMTLGNGDLICMVKWNVPNGTSDVDMPHFHPTVKKVLNSTLYVAVMCPRYTFLANLC